MSLTVSVGRYLFWLLGEWTIPVVLGIALGTGLCLWQLTETAELIEATFTHSLQSVVESCTAPTDPPSTASPPASVTGPPVAGDGGDTG